LCGFGQFLGQDGEAFDFAAPDIHRVLHAGEHPAVTIHAYSPPLVRTGTYRMGPTREFERVSLPIAEELRAIPAFS